STRAQCPETGTTPGTDGQLCSAAGGGLRRLLEVADLLQGLRVDDVGHRAMPLQRVVTRHVLPAVEAVAALLGQQRNEDAGLLLAEARQCGEALHEVL